MERIYDGFDVQLCRQKLISGEWGADDCEWDWDIAHNYFFDRKSADNFFFKQSAVCDKDDSIVMVQLRHCEIRYEFGEYRYATGDPIKEMDAKSGGGVFYIDWE